MARALVNDPDYVLADESTSDLDIDTEHDIMELFKNLNQNGKTIVMVTHNPELSSYSTRTLKMDRGKVIE